MRTKQDEVMSMDKDQFVQLVLEAEPTLFHVSFSILHHEQDCADAVQEAVVKAYEQRGTLKSPAYFKTWLVRIVMNECYQIRRKQKKRVPMEEKFLADDQKLSRYVREDYLDLYRAIAALKEQDKICILLFYMEDFTIRQIAGVLEIPEGTVKSRLNRAKRQLRGMLG